MKKIIDIIQFGAVMALLIPIMVLIDLKDMAKRKLKKKWDNL